MQAKVGMHGGAPPSLPPSRAPSVSIRKPNRALVALTPTATDSCGPFRSTKEGVDRGRARE